ncbi:unnamed protein product, partial [Ectocarpus sp. 13 AM-2016]
RPKSSTTSTQRRCTPWGAAKGATTHKEQEQEQSDQYPVVVSENEGGWGCTQSRECRNRWTVDLDVASSSRAYTLVAGTSSFPTQKNHQNLCRKSGLTTCGG